MKSRKTLNLHDLEQLLDSREPQSDAEISLFASGVIFGLCVLGMLAIVAACWVF